MYKDAQSTFNRPLPTRKMVNFNNKYMTTGLYNTLTIKTRIIDTSIEMKPLQYAKQGDAGIDLVATSRSYDEHGNVVYGTNRAFEIPQGYVGLLYPRSSNSKQDLMLSNSVGVIDSGYRGEVMFKFKRTPVYRENEPAPTYYEPGDRIGQLIIMPYPKVVFEEVQTLSNSERGAGGYGSTGK